MFDEDGNGLIEKEEIENLMGGQIIEEEVWLEFINESDFNKDGKVKN